MNKFLLGVAIAPLLLASQAQAAGTAITWAPASTDAFGNILVGSTSGSQPITVSRGTITTGTTTASIAGTVPNAEFHGAGASTLALLAGHPLSSSFTFAPTVIGAASETIAVTGKNGATTNSGVVTLSGAGVAPVGNVTSTYSPAYVLVGQTDSFAVTVTNSGNGNLSGATAKNGAGQVLSNLNGSFGTLAGLTGGGNALSLADGAKKSDTYSFAPTVKGQSVSGNLVTTLTNGGSNTNTAFTTTTAVSLAAVAPITAIVSDAAAVARYNAYGPTGGNATTAGVTGVTVTNTGNGDLASASLGVQRNLNGSFGSPSNVFSGPVSGGGFSLTDGAKTDVTYNFNPTARGVATTTIVGEFSNGSSDGKNSSFSVNQTLSGTGVGPTYASSVGATSTAAHANFTGGVYNTPVANTNGTSTIDFGTINSHKTETLYLDIGNITKDANGGNAVLTDLSLESFTLSGPGSSDFSIANISTVVAKGGDTIAAISFYTGAVSGSFSSLLTVQTDASTGFGLQGDTYSYNLVGSAVPEASTWAMMLAGFLGLGFVGLGSNKKARIEA
jgi:hypothetical protein